MEKNHICKKCGGIAGWDSYFQSWICTRCGNEEPKPTTNADRFRAMTDDKLAKWFGTHACCMVDPFFCSKQGGSCKTCWLDWLKQEAEEGET